MIGKSIVFKRLIEKLITKSLKKHGYKIDVKINELQIKDTGKDLEFSINASGHADYDIVTKIA